MMPLIEDGQELASLRLYNRFLASSLAGLTGGAAMLAIWLVAFAAMGREPWRPLQLAASAVLGEASLLPSAGIGTAIIGLFVHAAASALFGILFGVIATTRVPSRLMLDGLLFGAALAFSLHFLLLPYAISLVWALRMPLGASLAAHLAFGAVMAAVLLPFERRLITREFQDRAKHPTVVMPEEFPGPEEKRAA